MKKLIPALCMLLIAATLMGTSTFAWFSMNNKVTVTGMSIRTKVSNNLFIATDTLTSTAKKAESEFKTSLVQTKTALLEPVSTIDGKAFYYTSTSNVKGNGDAVNDVYVLYDNSESDDDKTAATDTTNYANAFSENYAVKKDEKANAYLDYVVQLKADNTSGVENQIRLTNLSLVYGGTDITDVEETKAYRIAMFVEDITDDDPAGELDDITATAIFTPEDAENQSDGQAVKDDDELAAVTYCSANTTAVITVPANTTKYFKVVLRLWLEGEDKTCTNANFLKLTDAWNMSAEFTMVASTETANAVIYIAGTNSTGKIELNGATVNTSSNTLKIAGTTYYEITGKTLDTKQLYTTDTTISATSKIYTIDNSLYPIDVTNQCKYTPAS